jgi:chromosome segregation ATPase
MKHSNIFLSCALLFVPSLSLLRAAPVHSGVTPEEEETKTISELQGQAAALADQADQFRLIIANNESSRESHLSMLDTLKAEINAMGRDLQTLEAERGTLSPWQVQAVDHSQPLLKDVAANTEQAISYFNNNGHLWTTQYREYVRNIWSDSDQISRSLKNYVALARIRDREQRLTQTIETAGASGQAKPENSASARGQ